MTTNSNIETAKPIRDIRWFWWQWRIRCLREKTEQLRWLGEQYNDTETVKALVDCLSTMDLIGECVDQLYNRNYKPGRFVYYDKKNAKKSLRVYTSYTKSTLSFYARGYRTLFGPFHKTLRGWRHYWFRRNLRQLIRLIRSAETIIRLREVNRRCGIGSASKYTQDNDPVIMRYHLFIINIMTMMRWNYDLYMDRNPFYKTFLGRRLQASHIRNGITALYWQYLELPDPNK